MGKTYRTCAFGCLMPWCAQYDSAAFGLECESCKLHEPRETPLLVDELAAALKTVWVGRFTDGDTSGQYPSGCERPGYTVMLTPEQCEMIQAALSCHQKEMNGA